MSRLKLGWLDAVLLLLIAACFGFVAWRLDSVLNYRWNWAPIPNYLLRWDAERGWVANLLLQGLLNTIRLTVWGMALAAVFVLWNLTEGTLSIHSILTVPRETFYWLAILVTFSLGTAAGDWTLELTGWSPGRAVLVSCRSRSATTRALNKPYFSPKIN